MQTRQVRNGRFFIFFIHSSRWYAGEALRDEAKVTGALQQDTALQNDSAASQKELDVLQKGIRVNMLQDAVS